MSFFKSIHDAAVDKRVTILQKCIDIQNLAYIYDDLRSDILFHTSRGLSVEFAQCMYKHIHYDGRLSARSKLDLRHGPTELMTAKEMKSIVIQLQNAIDDPEISVSFEAETDLTGSYIKVTANVL